MRKVQRMELPPFVRPAIWLVVAIAMAMLQASAAQAQEFSQILRGYQIAPVQLNLKGKDWALVYLGSYLVNTTGCNDCHTWPNWADGHTPYLPDQKPEQIKTMGYMAGGRVFLKRDGKTVLAVPSNLTPD